MNRRVPLLPIVLILVVGSLLFGQSKTAPASPPDKARLEQVMAAWATMDPSKAAVFYAKDPGLAFYDVAPRSYKGWAEYEKGAREMFKTMRSLSFKMHDADVHTAGNVAWATALVDAVVNDKDGKQEKMDARWTTVWEKRGNNWLIVHDHFSVPLPEPAPKPAATKKK